MIIEAAKTDQAEEIFSIYTQCKAYMEEQKIFQWFDGYPTIDIVEDDIKNGWIYCMNDNGKCIGVVSVNDVEDEEYSEVNWKDYDGDRNNSVMVVHRLAVLPEYQKKGIASLLMDFAEDLIEERNCSSIRLDTYSANERAINFYEKRGYEKRGEVFFTGRTLPFICYEKVL